MRSVGIFSTGRGITPIARPHSKAVARIGVVGSGVTKASNEKMADRPLVGDCFQFGTCKQMPSIGNQTATF